MFRRLVGNIDDSQLLKLFESEKSLTTQSFWQDRRPHFSELERHIANGPATNIGVLKGQDLVGATRLVPLPCRWPNNPKIYLDTDFFVHPDSRLGLTAGYLFDLRVRHTSETTARSIYFGIENKPHFMTQAQRVAKRYNFQFSFVGTTRLTQLFLTSEFKTSKSDGEKIYLRDCSDQFFSEFLVQFNSFNENYLLSPILDLKLKENILKFDDNAEIFFIRTDNSLSVGFLLIDMIRLRKFRWTPQDSLIRSKLNRRRKSEGRNSIEDNDVFLNKIVSLAWWAPSAQSQFVTLIQNAAQNLSRQNFDALIFRDIDFGPEDFLGPDILSFDRRVFILATNQDKENLEKLTVGELKFRLEPLYL